MNPELLDADTAKSSQTATILLRIRVQIVTIGKQYRVRYWVCVGVGVIRFYLSWRERWGINASGGDESSRALHLFSRERYAAARTWSTCNMHRPSADSDAASAGSDDDLPVNLSDSCQPILAQCRSSPSWLYPLELLFQGYMRSVDSCSLAHLHVGLACLHCNHSLPCPDAYRHCAGPVSTTTEIFGTCIRAAV